MRFQVSFIDHSAIEGLWPHSQKAWRDMHLQLDDYAFLRMSMGNALRPPDCRLLPLGGGLLAVVRRAEEGE
jgi:hypothetical protein